jgi:hypothetical protein
VGATAFEERFVAEEIDVALSFGENPWGRE